MENNKDYFHEVKYIDQNGLVQTTRVPVVQELARKGLNHMHERFISQDPPLTPASNDRVEKFSLPTIDVLKLRVESSRAEELAKLASCAKEWGMFLIKNHGVHNLVLDNVKDVVKGFYGLSFEEKKESVGSYLSADNMGYGRNYVKSQDQRLDWIDRMTMVAAPPVDDDQLQVWPKRPANFRSD